METQLFLERRNTVRAYREETGTDYAQATPGTTARAEVGDWVITHENDDALPFPVVVSDRVFSKRMEPARERAAEVESNTVDTAKLAEGSVDAPKVSDGATPAQPASWLDGIRTDGDGTTPPAA